jgi:hypothetical protein
LKIITLCYALLNTFYAVPQAFLMVSLDR